MHRADNESLGEVNLTTYTGALATSTWYDVQIPLTDFHASAAATTSRGFTFISDTITTVSFDTIRFISSSTQSNFNQAATTTNYLHADHLGGTNVVTNAAGSVTEVTDYYPYGSPRINTLSSGSVEQRKYIGEHFDTDTNLSYLNARYYEPTRGQFLSQDPVFWEIGESEDGRKILADPQLANSYSYAGGNPLTKKDPTGRLGEELVLVLLAPEVIPIVILAAVGALGLYYATQIDLPDPGSYRAETLKDGGSRFSEPRGGEPTPDPKSGWEKWILAGSYAAVGVYEFFDPIRREINWWTKRAFDLIRAKNLLPGAQISPTYQNSLNQNQLGSGGLPQGHSIDFGHVNTNPQSTPGTVLPRSEEPKGKNPDGSDSYCWGFC